jgi:hypothetical protein
MPLNPPPTIFTGLGLITQPLLRTDMTRAAQVTFACLDLTGGTAAAAQDMVDDFQANFNANMAPNIDNEVQIQPPTIRMGNGTTVPFEAVAAGATIAGGAAETSPTPNVAVLIKKSTGFGGKANRGRTYMPWFVDVSRVFENGTLDPVYTAAIQVHLSAFLAQLSADGTQMVIANKIFNTPLPPHYVTHITTTTNPVLSYNVEGIVATQRRRVRS